MIGLLAGLPSEHPPHRDGVTWWGLTVAVLLLVALAGWLLARGRRQGHHRHRNNNRKES